MRNILLLLHGYSGNRIHMVRIENTIKSWNFFDRIINLSLYSWFSYTKRHSIIKISDEHEVEIEGTIVEYIRKQLQDNLISQKGDVLHILGIRS